MVDVEQVRQAALGLPRTTEKPSYGTPGFRVADRLFARILDGGDTAVGDTADGHTADGGTLVVFCADESEKRALIASDPALYYSTPHYDGRAMVLARLAELDPDSLLDLLTESWRLRAPKKLVSEFDAQ